MENKFNLCKDKIITMLSFINNEYDKLMVNYTDEHIIKSCIPIHATASVNQNEQQKINDLLYSIFFPIMKTLSEMIRMGNIELSEISSKTELSEIITNKDKVNDLFYEAGDKLYFYEHLRYNLFFDFLMQMYLFFERESLKFFYNEFSIDNDNIFSLFSELEKRYNIVIGLGLKKELELYKNIINVYKHGYGRSFKAIISYRPDILNYVQRDDDMFFVFNLEKVSIEDFVFLVSKILEFLSTLVIQ